MDNWKETTLGEMAEFSNGRTSPERFDSGKYEVFGSNGVIGSSDETNSDANTIIIGRVGSYCGSLYFSKNKCWVTDNAIKANAKKISDPFYLYYLLITQKLNSKAAGSGQPLINQEILNSIDITLPPLPEQKAIAAILSSFDDKIELLRRQNKTLEKIAQTIFREWFVNFKVNGKQLKVNPATDLPEGWRIGKYNDLADVITGKGLSKEFIKEKGNYSVLGANGELGKTDKYLFDEDLILTGRVGTLGTIYISKGKVWISDNVLISKPLCAENFYFVYFNLKMLNFESLNRGSTQPLITQTDLKNVEVIIPKQEVLGTWHNIVLSLFDKIYNNSSQIQTLSKLRDALLPKLMKGEIRVKDTEPFVKEKIK